MRPVLLLLLAGLSLSARFHKTPSDTICLQPEEQKLYTLLMNYRKTKKLKAIPLSAKLTRVAQLHARDLAENYEFGKSDCNIHSWSEKGKWTSCCYTSDHKQANCMWNKPKEISGYDSPGFEISHYNSSGANADGSLLSWQQSQGHNRVIINEGTWEKMTWNAIGIGIYDEFSVVWFGQLEDETIPSICE